MDNFPTTPDQRESLGPIIEATVIVPRLEASIRAYTQGFGWGVTEPPAMLATSAAALVDGRLEGHPFAILCPPPGSASPGGVRLIEVEGVEPIEPLMTHGWSALEVSVLDVEAATARAQKAGWRVLFKPVVLGGGKLPLVAAQLAGPSGECVYLTQILGHVAGFDLPTPVSEVDGIFIVVLGCSSLENSRTVIEERFAVERVSDRELPVRVVNQQYGYPMDTVHRISSLQLSGRTCIEVDQLPADAAPRISPGGISAGILSVALEVSSAASADKVLLPDGALVELRAAPVGH